MMRLKMLLWFLLVVGTVTGAQANIGDDIFVLRKRFGSAKLLDDNHYIFLKNGFSITVYLDNQKSAMEVYVRQNEQDSQAPAPPFTDNDFKKILEKESFPNFTWKVLQTSDGVQFYERDDAKVLAQFNKDAAPPTAVFLLKQP